MNVAFAIKLFLKSNPLGRVFTESGLVTDHEPGTVRGPDVSYYSKERLPLGHEVVKWHDQEYRSVTILNAPDEGRTFYDEAALDGGDVLPGFACKVSDLFA